MSDKEVKELNHRKDSLYNSWMSNAIYADKGDFNKLNKDISSSHE